MELNLDEVNVCAQALGFMNAPSATLLRDRMIAWMASNAKVEEPKPVTRGRKSEEKANADE